MNRDFLLSLLKFIRLPLISIKSLVTEIRSSGYFTDDAIFEALRFKTAPEEFPRPASKEFKNRGYKLNFDFIHPEIEVSRGASDGSTFFKRVAASEKTENAYVSAISTSPLPLHGIHYWEIRLLNNKNPNISRKVFVGICNSSECASLEDTFKEKNSLLLYTYDSNFWNHGT